jgi:hypothetical protein
VISLSNLERFRRHLAPRANFIGIAVAGAMAILGILGLAGPLWPGLVVGCYALGAIIAPREQGSRVDLVRACEARDVVAALNKVRAQARRHTDSAIASRIDRIRRVAVALAADVENEPHVAANWETIRQVALEYLPATLENYLKIPKAYRRTVRGAGGKTAHHELILQINLLTKKMTEIAGAVDVSRLDEMFEYGQFLEARFRDPVSW